MILFKNRKVQTVSPEQGIAIWRAMNGEVSPSQRQRLYIKRVARVYLNKHTAPESYRRKYLRKETEQVAKQTRLPYKDEV